MLKHKQRLSAAPTLPLKMTQIHWIVLVLCTSIIGGSFFLTPDKAAAKRHDKIVQTAENSPARALQVSFDGPLVVPAVSADQLKRYTVTIKQGDTVSQIFSSLSISARQLQNIINLGPQTKSLAQLRPGQLLRVSVDNDHLLYDLVHEISRTRSLHISHRSGVFFTSTINRDLESRLTHARGVIKSSLFESGVKAGLPDRLIMDMLGIFGWDIDFALDIRSGDNYLLVYEENFLDGNKVGNGSIVAAEFTNRGTTYRAVRYTDPMNNTDYYTPDGHNMRKVFLRTPVHFSHISSRFGRRHHPVLNRMKLHKGVDYAASSGTPIRATGDGKIIYRGRKGGYGKTIILRHGGRYSTLYGHMSRYRPGLRVGSKVKQGQVIGYVGQTGLATGPHLHYEFRLNGVHRNPLTVPLPDASPIQAKFKADFFEKTRDLTAQLDQLKKTAVAVNK